MLLPAKFQTAMPQDGGLGPAKRAPTPAPAPHAHAWRTSASSAAHVVCGCGLVMLRELAPRPAPVKPAAIKDASVIDVEWSGPCQPDADGWIEHTGDVAPVSDRVHVDIKTTIRTHEFISLYAFQWKATPYFRITHWRPAK